MAAGCLQWCPQVWHYKAIDAEGLTLALIPELMANGPNQESNMFLNPNIHAPALLNYRSNTGGANPVDVNPKALSQFSGVKQSSHARGGFFPASGAAAQSQRGGLEPSILLEPSI